MSEYPQIKLDDSNERLINWVYRKRHQLHAGMRADATIPLHEYLQLVMYIRVLQCADRTYTGVPASEALIAREALSVPKSVRENALRFFVITGLLEKREEHGTMRYYPTQSLSDVLQRGEV